MPPILPAIGGCERINLQVHLLGSRKFRKGKSFHGGAFSFPFLPFVLVTSFHSFRFLLRWLAFTLSAPKVKKGRRHLNFAIFAPVHCIPSCSLAGCDRGWTKAGRPFSRIRTNANEAAPRTHPVLRWPHRRRDPFRVAPS